MESILRITLITIPQPTRHARRRFLKSYLPSQHTGTVRATNCDRIGSDTMMIEIATARTDPSDTSIKANCGHIRTCSWDGLSKNSHSKPVIAYQTYWC